MSSRSSIRLRCVSLRPSSCALHCTALDTRELLVWLRSRARLSASFLGAELERWSWSCGCLFSSRCRPRAVGSAGSGLLGPAYEGRSSSVSGQVAVHTAPPPTAHRPQSHSRQAGGRRVELQNADVACHHATVATGVSQMAGGSGGGRTAQCELCAP